MNNLLITGALHEDRIRYATELSMSCLCLNLQQNYACKTCHNCLRVLGKTHPNITYIEPLQTESEDKDQIVYKGEIKIEQVRSLVIENQKANYEEGLAIFIITHIHQITKGAANALLKSIEESGAKKVFLALAPSRAAVLPTIASRLISVSVKPSALPLAPNELSLKKIENITKLVPRQRFKLCEQFNSSRAELLIELENLQEECHTLLRGFPHECSSLHPNIVLGISSALSEACSLLERNANPRLVIEQLVLNKWPHAQKF